MADKHNFTTKIYKCCATDKDDLRKYALAVHFVDGFAFATEGHVLVKTSLEYQNVINPENLNGKSIHRDNFKEILKFEIAECCEDGVSCKNTDGQIAFYEYFDMQGEKIPNFNSAIPDKGKLKDIEMIGINPKYVDMLTSAMYSDSGTFRLRFTGADTAIIVDTIGFNEQIGIIMPAILIESLFD